MFEQEGNQDGIARPHPLFRQPTSVWMLILRRSVSHHYEGGVPLIIMREECVSSLWGRSVSHHYEGGVYLIIMREECVSSLWGRSVSHHYEGGVCLIIMREECVSSLWGRSVSHHYEGGGIHNINMFFIYITKKRRVIRRLI